MFSGQLAVGSDQRNSHGDTESAGLSRDQLTDVRDVAFADRAALTGQDRGDGEGASTGRRPEWAVYQLTVFSQRSRSQPAERKEVAAAHDGFSPRRATVPAWRRGCLDFGGKTGSRRSNTDC